MFSWRSQAQTIPCEGSSALQHALDLFLLWKFSFYYFRYSFCENKSGTLEQALFKTKNNSIYH